MSCTRDEGVPSAQESYLDGVGELVGVAIASACVLNYYVPQAISWPWNLVCGAAGLPEGCRARALALVSVRPIDAAAEWVGLGTPNSGVPVLGLNIVVLGVLLLSIPFVTGACYLTFFGEPPRPAPVFFRRTTGPDAGKIEPLGDYNGINRSQIYIAIKGRVFDVSSGAEFYGPTNGGYNALAGQDASRALGVMSLQGREAWLEDCRIRRIDDLGPVQQKVMRDYELKYCEKYPVVGVLLGKGSPMDLDFVPAQGGLVDAMAEDQQQTVTHDQLTRDCGRGDARESGDPTAKTQQRRAKISDSDDSETQLQCPNGHVLVSTNAADATYFCDGCGASGLPQKTATHSCHQCDFDLCEDCVAARK